MKSIKNIILSSVALFALSNNAFAQEILLDKQQLELEVNQELQVALQTLRLDIDNQVIKLEATVTDNVLLAKNETSTQKKSTEELAD